MRMVLGVDAGGTATRAVLATERGEVVGRGRAGAGNPVTGSPRDTVAALHRAVSEALGGVDPGRAAGAVLGIAGGSGLGEPATRGLYRECWRRLGLGCDQRVVGDAVVAYAAGSADPDGTVLIAGTGAVAARIEGWAVAATADGLGWLIGDEGSGFWLGRAAAASAARTLCAGRPPGRLATLVATHLLGRPAGPDDGEPMVRRLYADPGRLPELAPLVVAAYTDGDAEAAAIVREAADRLAATLLALSPAGRPVVLSGGVVGSESPVTGYLQRILRERLGAPATLAGDGAAAAAWLALDGLVDAPASAAARHRLL